jgi:arylsulfatase A-like enzyme
MPMWFNRDSRSLIVAFCLFLGIGGQACGRGEHDPGQRGDSRPDILLVVADDHGQWASRCYGNSEVLTPNLDRLAATGILVRRATSPGPVCSPARASLLTGRTPSQHGIHDFLAERPGSDRDWLAGEILLPELLRQNGYRTALIGKWHLAPNSLEPRGEFDRWVSFNVEPEGWRNQYLHRGTVHLSDQGTPVAVTGHQIEHLTRMAVEFITDQPAERPFFLLFAPTETHAPFEGHPERWLARYRTAAFSDVPRGETSRLPPSGESSVAADPPDEMLAQYYAAVSHQDEMFGSLLEALRAAGRLDNTLVIYTSDHGHMNGHHGLIGKSNATLPQNLYEETVRVPMVLSWRRGIRGGGLSLDIPFDHCDLFQTVLDAADVEIPAALEHRINSPGSSLLPFLEGTGTSWRRYQFTEHGNARLISDGRYKLVRRYPPVDPRFGDEFFDLAADPRESRNLMGDPRLKERIEAMARAMDEHFDRYREPGREGLHVMDMAPFNGREPWRRLAEGLSSRQ